MLLEGKCAVVYGAGGAIGAAVAKAFAAEGARVALTGPRAESLEPIMLELSGIGALAEVDIVDAYDEQSVEDHLRRLVAEMGRVDVSFNAVGLGYVIGVPLSESSVDKFTASVERAMLKRLPRLAEIGAAAALMASGHASAVTAAVMNVTCGGVMD